MTYFIDNKQANESISKYKLLSSYGGPGSILHTQYGSIIVSCIEEWGFIRKIIELHNEAIQLGKTEDGIRSYVIEQALLERNGSIGLSNDSRLLISLMDRIGLSNLKYLVLIPSVELIDHSNKVKGGEANVPFTIPSSFMPKVFSDKTRLYKSYKEWFLDWIQANTITDKYGETFFPPKKLGKHNGNKWEEELIQDNIVLICENGHISDFPWSQYLEWRDNNQTASNKEVIELFNNQRCCNNSEIKITSSNANASGFDGKWLKCDSCKKQTSLKGLMSLKIKCQGEKPWEADVGDSKYYGGDKNARTQYSPREYCTGFLKVALSTGNNLYFSRVVSSIYIPDKLFMNERILELKRLEVLLDVAKNNNNFEEAIKINNSINSINDEQSTENTIFIPDSEKEVKFRYDEFIALTKKTDVEINIDEKSLKVKDVTENLGEDLAPYFSKILRIDNMKVTSSQLDFSRVLPADADASTIKSKNIFKGNQDSILAYPVVENYGEGILFAFDYSKINEFASIGNFLNDEIKAKLLKLNKESNNFSEKAIEYGVLNSWQLYLVHTFTHLIIKELEFQCGYPTASLSERIYISNDEKYKMYGCMIYTAEGAEGSMGGVIAQTRKLNLNKLIKNALIRATICHSDPLCWESEGQGLFDLNFSACFSCSLVSETTCELRNIYLDRKILVDSEVGFFRGIIR